MLSDPTEPESVNGATPQLPSDTRTTDPAIEDESTDTVYRLPGRQRDHLRSSGHLSQPPPPPTGPLLLAPSPLIRSASAPPDYVPSLPASRQHRATRGPRPVPSDDDFRAFQPMPPEVVETGRREKECSACCLRCIVVMTTLRWMFVSAALLGAGCVVTGIVFGVMSSTLTMDKFFVLAFIFIGLGIVLVLVVGIGWRCTPVGREPCHAFLHLTDTTSDRDGPISYDTGTQRAPRLMQRSRNQWYGGFLYPEFRYVTPPPSYSTSMQQYRQQTVQQDTADRDRTNFGNISISSLDNLSSLPSSPPPTYRSRAAGRIRPSLSGVMALSCTTSDDLPPPYRNSSTASSLDRLADVEEIMESGASAPVSTTPATFEPTTSDDHCQAPDPSSYPQEGGVVADLATPTAHVTNQTEVKMRASFSLVPEDVPEVLPSVRSIVQSFEYLAKTKSTKDHSEKVGQSSNANDHLHNFCSLSGAIDSTDLASDQNFDDEGQLRIHQRSAKPFPAEQSHSQNRTDDDDDLCSVSQSPKTSFSINQSNATISVEGFCSFDHSSNVQSDNDQSHVRISMRDVDSCSVYLFPDNPSTSNQSQASSTASTNRSDLGCQSPPTSSGNLTTNAYAVSQSQAETAAAFCFCGQSRNSRPIQILQAANHFQVSSSSNQSYHDFSRSQSLDDHEIGESGI